MKKNKRITAWEVLDVLWEKFDAVIKEAAQKEDLNKYKNITWQELTNLFAPPEADAMAKEFGMEHFRYEAHFVFRTPVRSMKWLYGEHALLYDVFGCKEHKFTMVTHDDQGMILGQTALCPYCNSENMIKGREEEYMKTVEGQTHSEEEWKQIMKISKWHKDYNRKEHIKYLFEQWTRKGYLQYRLRRLFESFFEFDFGRITP